MEDVTFTLFTPRDAGAQVELTLEERVILVCLASHQIPTSTLVKVFEVPEEDFALVAFCISHALDGSAPEFMNVKGNTSIWGQWSELVYDAVTDGELSPPEADLIDRACLMMAAKAEDSGQPLPLIWRIASVNPNHPWFDGYGELDYPRAVALITRLANKAFRQEEA